MCLSCASQQISKHVVRSDNCLRSHTWFVKYTAILFPFHTHTNSSAKQHNSAHSRPQNQILLLPPLPFSLKNRQNKLSLPVSTSFFPSLLPLHPHASPSSPRSHSRICTHLRPPSQIKPHITSPNLRRDSNTKKKKTPSRSTTTNTPFPPPSALSPSPPPLFLSSPFLPRYPSRNKNLTSVFFCLRLKIQK